MDNIFINAILYKRIMLMPNQIDKNINNTLLKVLRQNVEGICINEGYVKEGTIKILKRSIGKIQTNQFKATIYFKVIYTADICNPSEGSIIKCKVDNINKLGILSNKNPLSIIIAKQYHENKSLFKDIKLNQEINVEVIGKKFIANDNIISVIGKIYEDPIEEPLEIKLDDSMKNNLLINNNNKDIDNDYILSNDIYSADEFADENEETNLEKADKEEFESETPDNEDDGDNDGDNDNEGEDEGNDETFEETYSNKIQKNVTLLENEEETEDVGDDVDDDEDEDEDDSDNDSADEGFND